MSEDWSNYALPLFSLVNREKVDPTSPQMEQLAEQLQGFLAQQFDLQVLDVRIEQLAREPYLVLNGVASDGLPKLLALADVQRCQLFSYHRDSEDLATLTPVAVRPGES